MGITGVKDCSSIKHNMQNRNIGILEDWNIEKSWIAGKMENVESCKFQFLIIPSFHFSKGCIMWVI